MTKTFKIKHNSNFDRELGLARKVAEYSIKNKDHFSFKDVAHLGLRYTLANSIMWKYGRNKKAKVIKSVPLIVRGTAIRLVGTTLKVKMLNFSLELPKVIKFRQIELDKEYAYITHEVDCARPIKARKHIGVDLNTTGHCAVVAVRETGKVYKLGKKAEHIHKKYKQMRRKLQGLGKYGMVKKIKNRESRIIKDLNHKISRFIVNLAIKEKGGLQLEKLQGIRKTTKSSKSFKYALNSWSYFQLGKFLEYKALLAGIPLSYIEPAYTSKSCSRCGLLGERNDKLFKCPNGHAEHADANAAFNIALLSPSIIQLQEDRDFCKRNTDVRQRATN